MISWNVFRLSISERKKEMGSSRIIITYTKKILLAHICSGCGFPVISILTIKGKGEKSVTLLGKDQERAEELAQEAVRIEINRIKKCSQKRTVLFSEKEYEDFLGPGQFRSAFVEGHTDKCPYCNNLEPWQAVNDTLLQQTKKTISKLDIKNFPTVFTDVDEAKRWAESIILNQIKKINEIRQDNYLVEQAKNRVEKAVERIHNWQYEIDTIPELLEKERTEKEYNELLSKKSKLGIFDVKGRRIVSSKIREIKRKLQELNCIYRKKETSLKSSINNEKENLLYDQAIAYGCSDEILMIEKRYSICFQYKPSIQLNDLIDSSYRKIESKNTNKKEGENESCNHNEGNKQIENGSEIKFCRKCGFKLKPDSDYCSKCGVKID